MELFVRFLVGGAVVSFFAIVGDALKPKSFAGLLGAAPSVALATLSLTVLKNGRFYAATEAESMVLGAIAFFIYACLVSTVLMRGKAPVFATTAILLLVWVGAALGLRFLVQG
jgi:hypothetical protein